MREPKNFSSYELQQKILNMHKKFYTIKRNPFIKKSPNPWYKRAIHAYAKKIIWDIEHEPQTVKHIAELKLLEKI